jgi:integrase
MASIYALGRRSGAQRGCFYTNIPQEVGAPIQRTTGTKDAKLAHQIGAMVDRLGPRGQRRWDVLGAVVDRRLTLAELWDAYSRDDLDGLMNRLDDVDLSPLVDEFSTAHATRVTPAHATLAKVYIRKLIPSGARFPRTKLTPAFVGQFLDGLGIKTDDQRQLASGTRLKYHAALCALCRWLTMNGHLADNPMRLVKKPKAGDPRSRHLSFENAVKLVKAAPPSFRAIEALAHCGMEMSAILRLVRGDVDLTDRTVHAKGTKTAWRNRKVPIQVWALPFVKLACRGKLPSAPLFPGLDNDRVHKTHDATCKLLGAEFAAYRFHDARRTFGIAALKNGATHEAVAYVLGHKDARLVFTTYAKFAPNLDALRACDPSGKRITSAARRA